MKKIDRSEALANAWKDLDTKEAALKATPFGDDDYRKTLASAENAYNFLSWLYQHEDFFTFEN